MRYLYDGRSRHGGDVGGPIAFGWRRHRRDRGELGKRLRRGICHGHGETDADDGQRGARYEGTLSAAAPGLTGRPLQAY